MNLFRRREVITELKEKECCGIVPLVLVCWFKEDGQFELIRLKDDTQAQARLDAITIRRGAQPLGFIGYDPSDADEPVQVRLLSIYHELSVDAIVNDDEHGKKAFHFLCNIADAVEVGIGLENKLSPLIKASAEEAA